MFGDASQAEDLTQDVFLRVYRARRGYEPTAKFSTWLFQIATNLTHNARRSKGRRREIQFPTGADSQALKPGENLVAEKSALMPSRLADQGEVRERIREAIESLGERQKMALLLHKFEGLQYTEIGEIMDMTPQAVKSLLSRARESLRAALASYVS
jgi:RNA polymerase sigma-70 factor (ECF subfamily)